jgi:hypothetical protein
MSSMKSKPTKPKPSRVQTILDSMPAPEQRPAARYHVRAARRSAELAAKQLAAGACSQAHGHLMSAARELAKADYAQASPADLAAVRADIATVERSFNRCVVQRPVPRR